jgi:quercetin dioxygenase-like cupin family protein
METLYSFNSSTSKLIEKIINNDEVIINHMIFNEGDHLPEHNANSNVYMIVIHGVLTLQLGDQSTKYFTHGNIINIPYGTKMNVSNTQAEQTEFFVIKAPNPRVYKD